MRACALAAGLALAALAAPASAVVVDDFESGAFVLLAFDGAEAVLQQGPLPAEQALFGRREITLLPGGASDAAAELMATSADDALTVDADLGADLALTWEPATLGSVASDWTDGGAADRLAITVAETTHPLRIEGAITSLAPAPETRSFSIEAPGSGTYEVPFASLDFGDPAALAAVGAFTLAVLPEIDAPGGSRYALSDVRTVPEPAAAGPAAIAALALSAGAARRSEPCRSS